MSETKHTPEQIAAMRQRWGIPDRFVPVAAASGVVGWASKAQPSIRDQHYQRLNAYRDSAEYAAYAKDIGADVPSGDLPKLMGNRWEIDRATYEHFLEILPPLAWKGGTFFMREFAFDDVTTKYTREGDKYFCEFARYPVRLRSSERSGEESRGR